MQKKSYNNLNIFYLDSTVTMPLSSWILECLRLHMIHYNVINRIAEYSTLQDCHLALSYVEMEKELLPPGTGPEEIERQRLFFAPDEHGVSPAETALNEMLEEMGKDLKAVTQTRKLHSWERCGRCYKAYVACTCCVEELDTITSVCQCGRITTYPSDSPQACSCIQ